MGRERTRSVSELLKIVNSLSWKNIMNTVMLQLQNNILKCFYKFPTASVVRVLDYRYRGPGFDSRALQKKVVGLERGPLSLVTTTEELFDRKVAAPV
jgi:hypothetical protein